MPENCTSKPPKMINFHICQLEILIQAKIPTILLITCCLFHHKVDDPSESVAHNVLVSSHANLALVLIPDNFLPTNEATLMESYAIWPYVLVTCHVCHTLTPHLAVDQ